MHLVISRAEARAKGRKRYFTGKACVHGHVAERYASSSGCVECRRVRATTKGSRIYGATYRHRNRERLNKQSKAWARTKPGQASAVLNRAKKRARARGLEFDLDLAWVKRKLDCGRCEVTGLEFSCCYGEGGHRPYSPSVDKKNPAEGYTKENCRLVLWAVNCALNDWGLDAFAPIAARLATTAGEYEDAA
jgi:hypothetical protein